MNRIIPITACGVENMSATKIAELLWEQEREIERLTAEVKRLAGEAGGLNNKSDKPRNRVLTLEEARALPDGTPVWVEARDRSGRKNGYCDRTRDYANPGLLTRNGIGLWCVCDSCGSSYERIFRTWSDGEPTPEESASVPWKEAPDA